MTFVASFLFVKTRTIVSVSLLLSTTTLTSSPQLQPEVGFLAKITHDILNYHASPVEAAEIARDARVGHLLYYHIVPPLIVPGTEAAWLTGVDEVFRNYTVGIDGTAFSLPAGSTEIAKLENTIY